MKKIGVLGTGMVGKTIANRLIELGYQVIMGSRTPQNTKALEWQNQAGENASIGTFKDVCTQANIIFNCIKGESVMDAIQQSGLANLTDKVLIDLTNPLDFSKGMPPSLISQFANTWSLAEAIQQYCPHIFVVKTLNMVNCEVMVNAEKSGADSSMMLCGNNLQAKFEVSALLKQFAWKDIIDLGELDAARGMEMMLPIWLKLWKACGTAHIGFKINR